MFEWDEEKRQKNLKKHGIDFVKAKEIWQSPVLEIPSPQTQHGEPRFLAIGKINEFCITVIYTSRKDKKRLISARKARKYEQEDYNNATR